MPRFGITHESGTLKRVLVHHPGRELELANLDPSRHNFDQPVDTDRFTAEHQGLTETLAEAGVEVLDVGALVGSEPWMAAQVARCPNLVFARDSSVVTDAGVILMRMGLPSRRLETPIIKAAHGALGLPVGLELGEPITFEGGGFALLEGRVATVWFQPVPYICAICSCEVPQCGGLRLRTDFGLEAVYKAEYVADVDPDRCQGCAACVSRCQFGAIRYSPTLGRVMIDQTKCFGCGLCRDACDFDALKLIPREQVPGLRGRY